MLSAGRRNNFKEAVFGSLVAFTLLLVTALVGGVEGSAQDQGYYGLQLKPKYKAEPRPCPGPSPRLQDLSGFSSRLASETFQAATWEAARLSGRAGQ